MVFFVRYEYMTAYIESAKQVGRLENAIGWYHSHPGKAIVLLFLKAIIILSKSPFIKLNMC
jgi:hypothetical protein